ncbi:uncharacterized protein KY384_003037 [Bacidia gigantensis]|uniref:uncharacterized protein n=1 Tax=Bacidia gigantensis TaxID=2732470 RepID=UPI001D04150E|nr:uncharacterized protein KY384_003037 [Bacidia gigantensis]KAG8531408.1 hypothetical protein KY384_003037 [Bacidia gigantensis]
MPYTPPSHRSPAASQSGTPPLRVSTQTATGSQNENNLSHGSRPSPSRSTSQAYLHKHRRSPSVSKPTAALAGQATSETNGLDSQYSHAQEFGDSSTSLAHHTHSKNSGINGLGGGTESPASSGDEESAHRGWSSDAKSLAELHAAIRGIDIHRQGSPEPEEGQSRADTMSKPTKPSLNQPADVKVSDSILPHTPPLSSGARKISHSRSTTDASAFFDFPRNKMDSPAPSESEDGEDEDDLEMKPCLLRKKSGELVRPALRPAAKRRPSSMPGTPTYSKNVHFQETSLEHVRHFLQVDRPIAVSAGTSPVSIHDEDSEFPFGGPDAQSVSPPYDWEIRLPNFPRDTIEREARLLRTEKVFLSADKKNLLGDVVVRNIAFHKLVLMRFTLDYWKTTSEVKAEYNKDIRKKPANAGCDIFTFEIKLEDLANLENRTMLFCVRYAVDGHEYWDNNDSMNYQVDFSKQSKGEDGKQGSQPASSRPLNGMPRNKSAQPRPRSMPSFDDFGSYTAPFDFGSFPQPNAMVGESPIRFKNRPPAKELVPDAPAKPRQQGNQQAFSTRYDFGASLSAAIQSGSNTMPTALPPKGGPSPFQSQGLGPGNGGEQKVKAAPSKGLSKPTALFGSCKPISQPRVEDEKDNKSEPPTIVHASSTSSPPSEASSTSTKATGSASPSPPRAASPSAEIKIPAKSSNPASSRASRSVSPAIGSALGSRSHSPGFGYHYNQHMQDNFFQTHTPTPIQG